MEKIKSMIKDILSEFKGLDFELNERIYEIDFGEIYTSINIDIYCKSEQADDDSIKASYLIEDYLDELERNDIVIHRHYFDEIKVKFQVMLNAKYIWESMIREIDNVQDKKAILVEGEETKCPANTIVISGEEQYQKAA